MDRFRAGKFVRRLREWRRRKSCVNFKREDFPVTYDGFMAYRYLVYMSTRAPVAPCSRDGR